MQLRSTKPLVWSVVAAIGLGVGFLIWKLYGDWALMSRTAPLGSFIREEMQRAEKALAGGARFQPSACNESCPYEFLASYGATESAELQFLLRAHPAYRGKTVRYRPQHPGPASGPERARVLWICETDLEYPARSHFPRC